MVVVCCRGNDGLSIDRVIRERERSMNFMCIRYCCFPCFSFLLYHHPTHIFYSSTSLSLSLTRAKVVKFSNLRRYDMENVNFLRSIIRIAQTHRHEAHSCIHSFSYAFPCHDFSFLSFVLQGFLCASV